MAEPEGGVRAADTVLALLEAVAFAREPQGVTQLAAAVGATKGAAFRHLHTLLDRGYLTQDADTARYALGPRALLIGRCAPPAGDLAAVLAPAMREARDACGLAVVLSTPTPRGAFVLATLPGTRAIEIGVRPGSDLAPHASAQGKVGLAFGPAAAAERALAAPGEALTPRTITAPAALREELARVRAAGYAVAPEEALLGVNALAAPVRDAAGRLAAILALVGSIQHIAPVPDPALVRTVLALAERATRLLRAGTPPPDAR